MKLIYKAKWVIVVLFAIVFAASFAVLFVGGTAEVNRWLLAANLLLIIAQSANVVYAFRNRHKDVGGALLFCLINRYWADVGNIHLELELYCKSINRRF